MNIIKFGKIESKISGDIVIPVIEILTRSVDTNENLGRAYLQPFHQYCFQVTGNKEDSAYSIGSSCEIGLKHCYITSIGEGPGYETKESAGNITRELLLGQAIIAVLNYAYNCHNIMNITIGDIGGYYGEGKKLRDFIDEVYMGLTK